MGYLSEDPTFLVGGLLLLAVVFLVALRATQQGKYLVRALIAVGLAAVVLAIDWFWVTDRERIEQLVFDLRAAVLASDANAVLKHLAPEVVFQQGEAVLNEQATRGLVRSNVERARFDVLRVRRLRSSVGEQSRRGSVEFEVLAKGTVDAPVGQMAFGTADMAWSLGVRETAPGVWKVNRITPVRGPREIMTRLAPRNPNEQPR